MAASDGEEPAMSHSRGHNALQSFLSLLQAELFRDHLEGSRNDLTFYPPI